MIDWTKPEAYRVGKRFAALGPMEAVEAAYRAAGLWPSAVAMRAIASVAAELAR